MLTDKMGNDVADIVHRSEDVYIFHTSRVCYFAPAWQQTYDCTTRRDI